MGGGQGSTMLTDASTYLSPLMKLVGLSIFIQPVPARPGAATSPCVAQLMAAPSETPSDSMEWLNHVGTVVAFSPEGDMLPADVLSAWKFALCVAPMNYASQEAFLAMFTPDVYAAFVRDGRLPGRVDDFDEEHGF